MEFHNLPQPTRPTSFSNLTSFKYSSTQRIVLQDCEPSTSTSNLQQQDIDEDEVFNELTQILFECLGNVDNDHKGLLLRKIFMELEKESQMEDFIVEKLKRTHVKVISEFIGRYNGSLTCENINQDEAVHEQQKIVCRGLNDDVIKEGASGGSMAKLLHKLERFKVKTINIEGGVIVKK